MLLYLYRNCDLRKLNSYKTLSLLTSYDKMKMILYTINFSVKPAVIFSDLQTCLNIFSHWQALSHNPVTSVGDISLRHFHCGSRACWVSSKILYTIHESISTHLHSHMYLEYVNKYITT